MSNTVERQDAELNLVDKKEFDLREDVMVVLPEALRSGSTPWFDPKRVHTSCGSSCPTSLPSKC